MACLALGTTVLTSCFNDNTTVPEVPTDCVVTAFQLDKLQRTVQTRTKDGQKDSTYVQNIPASAYPFSIDQERNSIYNLDSLPKGADLSRVKLQTFNANGLARLVSLVNKSDTIISANTEVDLTKPRTLNVYGFDGVSKRSYTVEVRVHREEPNEVTWSQPTEAQWTAQNFEFEAAGSWSANGRKFRVNGAKMFTSTDGTTWNTDSMDVADAAFLPDVNVTGALLVSREVKGLQEWVMYGTKEGKASVWSRKWDTNGTYHFRWERVISPTEQGYVAPVLEQPQMLAFDGGLLLVGRTAQNEVVMRFSRDHGRTWVQHPDLVLPTHFSKTQKTLQAAIDKNGLLWLHTDNGVWRARLHRLSWIKPQVTYSLPSTK